jgi:hypothetical protein
MKFTFDDKDYDSDILSDNGKLYLGKLQNITNDQQILSSSNLTDCEDIKQKAYAELLKAELPKEEEKQTSKK